MNRVQSFREHHDAWVTAWMSREARSLRPVQRIALFDQAFAAIWRRAQPTIGDLTLTALVERTLREVVGTFPQLASLSVEAEGISFRELRESGGGTRDPELGVALRFLLVELLSALGSLTGETLTPLLHQELAKSGTALAGEPPQRPPASL